MNKAIKSLITDISEENKTRYNYFRITLELRNKRLIINHKAYYKRNFNTTSVNQIWTTDVSEFHITEGKLYLSPIIDVHNREIVSYTISRSPNDDNITI